MDNHFGGVIWTNHAIERMRQRGIKQGDAWATWRSPMESRKGSAPGSWIYFRTYAGTRIEVVAKQNEKKEWLILSVWSRPVISSGNKNNMSLLTILIRKLFG
ncbi:MAG: hypothetical protein ACD_13C00022G0007 [uncultured bacterium]|uniref:DUF4258 domain-containing protein n=1 Tax=Candidatus Woesebacteria bacterium GW2011_GWA1_40_43 TaxID=1618553 RepID=A0A0G0VNN3_9BACT|nr:MAG: hypothetical protein ACD_13C00022G0007 [uncultured bacterium]KKR53248.1 MAG: hypothetical protein UT88_C0012G0012 [Candidatus Woesebacteria bacterium GW2011_GWD2_40_19]KKR58087.1 MAG: hypothetical protein UT96_C0010G0013 [Candidatus Woesebacteria bacterium GW2011_GWC2_40_30]KKR64377.1 MAG: hypothetical protein UU02_C0009G0026 [Candidatus Woesebacteria bacterium GW2011_GWA1_40_43]HAU64979.1 hypothetical protein [Candidatus Woesebacteria bacterium]